MTIERFIWEVLVAVSVIFFLAQFLFWLLRKLRG